MSPTSICEFSRELDPEHGRIAFEIEFAALDEFAQRDDLFFLPRRQSRESSVRAGDSGTRQSPAPHVRRRRDHARRIADFHREIAPIRSGHLRVADENVRVEVDHFLAQLAIESGHDRDDQNEHGHTERHAEDGDERDDRKKRALRFQVAKREEKAERQFQIADTVAAIR